jgi:hypothetical protein
MSRTLTSLRASITLGALLLGALHGAHAADAPAQRLAMARTSEAVIYKAPTQVRQVSQRADITVAKATQRRAQESRSDLRDSDGTRFTYDSCGCSN